MLFLDERVGCIAVYENDTEINCMSDIDIVEKLHYYSNGFWDSKDKKWCVPDKVLKEAKELYEKLKRTTKS